ncbi:protein FAM163A [Ictalurus punctatus]|uniref:Protein FAM163A n=1 Tax=Ictalurus punctatus TaxID=7998 RepID=A0A2D0RCF1_ICTPU|nr:protein FAM163A [Ictalurus punctatus]
MSAGTVVISGGFLAAVILLCIITVLCYCRLQRYCCECDVSESVGVPVLDARPRICSDVCSVDGVTRTLLPLTSGPSATHSYCLTCSPYYRHDDVCNANMWLAIAHGEPRGVTALGTAAMMNFYTNTHAISTDV